MSIEVIPYVQVIIRRHPHDVSRGSYSGDHLYTYDIPRHMLDRWGWVISWRCARYQCQSPRDHISTSHHFYDKKLGIDMNVTSLYSKYQGARAMVTKITNKMAQYKAAYKGDMFLPKAEDTEAWQKAEAKLKEYQAKVILLENQVKQQIENS